MRIKMLINANIRINSHRLFEVDSMVKEDLDRKIRALTRQSEDFDKIG